MSDEDKKSVEQDENAQEIDDSEVDSKEITEDSEASAEAPETKDEKSDSKKETDEQKERPVWTMPVAKAQEEKRKAVEKAKQEAKEEVERSTKAEIDRLKAELEAKQDGGDDYRQELSKVAEEYGLDTKAAEGLLNVFKKSIKLPDISKYDQILKEKEIEGHKLQVSKEFDERVVNLIKKDFPNATSQYIQEVKEKITDLAFSKGYNTYRLEDIYRVKKDDLEFKDGYSAESTGGRGSDLRPFDKMTDDEEHKLASSDPAKYREYLKAMSTQGSRYLD